jgi:hypothetical protein
VDHVAVGIADDLQRRVGVHADQPLDLDAESGFLLDLPYDRLPDGFAELHGASRQSPQAVIRAPLQEDLALPAPDDGGNAGTDLGGAVPIGFRVHQALQS